MIPKPPECSPCLLYKGEPAFHLLPNPRGFSQPEGTCANHVLAFGEALGGNEESEGLPFRPGAEAGSVLEGAFRRLGLSRQSFAIYNIVNCRPPRNWLENAPWEHHAISSCKVHRDRVVAQFKPHVLLALGGVAFRTLTGLDGEKLGISYVRGYAVPAIDYALEAGLLDCKSCAGKGRTNSDDSFLADDCPACEGKGCVFGHPIPVIGTFHPSFIKRGETRFLNAFYHDILKAVEIGRMGWDFQAQKDRLKYTVKPDHERALRFLQQAEMEDRRARDGAESRWLTYDIETSYSAYYDEDDTKLEEEAGDHIRLVQFSLGAHTGIAFPFEEPFIGIAKQLFALKYIKKAAFNNWEFDDPRLQRVGMKFETQPHDLRWAWHHLQPDLLANLQFAASFYEMGFIWKHLAGSDLEWYGCADVDAPQRMIRRPGEGTGVFEDLAARGLTRGYERHIYRFRPVLAAIERRGIPVNDKKRQELGDELVKLRLQYLKEMQPLAPEELRNVHPKEGYKKEPTGIKEFCAGPGAGWDAARQRTWIRENFLAPPIPGEDQENEARAFGQWDFREFTSSPVKAKPRGSLEALGDMREGVPVSSTVPALDERGMQWRWCIIKPFLPSSSPQVLAYIRYKGYRVPKDFKTQQDTTAAKELERLQKKHNDPLFKSILDYRSVDKMIGTYVKAYEPKILDEPAADGTLGRIGRIHTTFTFLPATGQLSSKNPNVQNIPKHKDIAKRFRGIIEAPAGHYLLEVDYSSAHALTTGFEARDARYMRLAKLDMHSFLGSYLVDPRYAPSPDCVRIPFELNDDELRRRLKLFKSCGGKCTHTEDDQKAGRCCKFIRDKQAKPAILGYGFGLGERHFYEANQEYLPGGMKLVKMIYATLGDLFGVAKKWRDEIRMKAYRDTFLLSRHGHIRWFFDVYHYDARRGCRVSGNDSEKAIAFLPANDAFGHIRDAMLDLEEQGWNEMTFRPDGFVDDRVSLRVASAGLVNQVHDSLVYLVPAHKMDIALPAVCNAMLKPSLVLKDPELAPDGLVIGVEASVGRDWAHMEGVDYKTGWSKKEERLC